MITTLDSGKVVIILQDISTNIHNKVEYLTELDSVLGDGDHGSNLDRGFGEVSKRVSQYDGSDVGVLLELAGSTLISSVGGASGPLYGTMFRKAGKACQGKSEIGVSDVTRMFQAAEAGIVSLGGAQVGDKTILDSLHPAAEAARVASDSGVNDLVSAFEKITSSAEAGLESTKNLVASKGRASYLGERGIGHYDVGAASFCIILRSMLETLQKIDRAQNS